jgi:hypothetical protein
MLGDRSSRSLVIPTRVLRFEVFGRRRRTPGRLVLPTSQIGPVLLHFVDQPRNPLVFLVNQWKPR